MRQALRWFFVFSFLSIAMFVANSPVQAQTETESSEMSALREQYATQLDVYRSDARNFEILQDQYTQLKTLTSLEDAVEGARKVLLSRNAVLLTYLKMLRINLNETTGIQLQLKEAQLKTIDDIMSLLEKNQDLVSKAVTKEQITAATTDFTTVATLSQSASTDTASLVTYGKIQALFDKTVVVKDDIKTHILETETDALKKSQKQRAFDQIDQNVTEVDGNLKSVLATLNGTNTKVKKSSQTSYLNQAYAGISRTLGYLKEVLAY